MSKMQLDSEKGMPSSVASEACESSLRSSKPLPYFDDMEGLKTLSNNLQSHPSPSPDNVADSLGPGSCKVLPYLEGAGDVVGAAPSRQDAVNSLAPSSCKALPYLEGDGDVMGAPPSREDAVDSLAPSSCKVLPYLEGDDHAMPPLSADEGIDSLDVRSCRPLPYLDTEAW
jgi:hypothetical protein